MSYKWMGVFEKDNERRTHNLAFTALDVETAHQIIVEYVEGVQSQGWKLVENEVKIS